MKLLRIDDISINSDLPMLVELLDFIFQNHACVDVILGITPCVFNIRSDDAKVKQRVFPSINNAKSDYGVNFYVEKAGLPENIFEIIEKYNSKVKTAGHGIVHTDHRLLNFQAQELSIVSSCSLAQSNIFIPPFNKWNEDTKLVCEKRGIELIVFEDGWSHLSYIENVCDHDKIYTHLHDYTMAEFLDIFRM